MRECLFLVSHGVPLDVAFGLDDLTRTAWCIIVSEQQSGKKFNLARMEFVDA